MIKINRTIATVLSDMDFWAGCFAEMSKSFYSDIDGMNVVKLTPEDAKAISELLLQWTEALRNELMSPTPEKDE